MAILHRRRSTTRRDGVTVPARISSHAPPPPLVPIAFRPRIYPSPYSRWRHAKQKMNSKLNCEVKTEKDSSEDQQRVNNNIYNNDESSELKKVCDELSISLKRQLSSDRPIPITRMPVLDSDSNDDVERRSNGGINNGMNTDEMYRSDEGVGNSSVALFTSCRNRRRGVHEIDRLKVRESKRSVESEGRGIIDLCNELNCQIERVSVIGHPKLQRIGIQMLLYRMADLTLPELGAVVIEEEDEIYRGDINTPLMTPSSSSSSSISFETPMTTTPMTTTPMTTTPMTTTPITTPTPIQSIENTSILLLNRNLFFAHDGFLVLFRLLMLEDPCFDEGPDVIAAVRNDCLNLLREYLITSPAFAASCKQTDGLFLRLIELLPIPANFNFAESLAEEIVSIHDLSVDIQRIPFFSNILATFSPRQLALSTRLLSLIVFEAPAPSSCLRTLALIKEKGVYKIPPTLRKLKSRQESRRSRERLQQRQLREMKSEKQQSENRKSENRKSRNRKSKNVENEVTPSRLYKVRPSSSFNSSKPPKPLSADDDEIDDGESGRQCNCNFLTICPDSIFHSTSCRWFSDHNHDSLLRIPGLLEKLVSDHLIIMSI